MRSACLRLIFFHSGGGSTKFKPKQVETFEEAVSFVDGLRRREKWKMLTKDNVYPVPDDRRLTLYSLYKQSTKGDVQGKRPIIFRNKARIKWDSWHKLKGKLYESCLPFHVCNHAQFGNVRNVI